jgi:alkyl hydroperoxide reductase subunit AhpC
MRIGTILPDLPGASNSGLQSLHEVMQDGWTVFVKISTSNRENCRKELGVLGACMAADFQTGARVIGVGDPSDLGWQDPVDHSPGLGSANRAVVWACDKGSAIVQSSDSCQLFFAGEFNKAKVVLIVGPDKRVHLSMSLPACSTLNPLEIVRCLKALMVVHGKPLATPANWKFGEDLIVGTSLDDAAAERAYGPVRTVLSYLRYVTFPLHLISSTKIDRE